MLDEWEDWWLLKLSKNLLGYATVAVPGALLVYYVKRSKYLESPDSNCLLRCVSIFVHGDNESKLVEENGTSEAAPSHTQKLSLYWKTLTLIFCFLGLQASYLTWGVLQEKIMTVEYHSLNGGVKKFSDSQFLVFVNRVLAFLFAFFYILISKQPQHTAPLYKYSYCSFSNIVSSWCQYEALKYVSFPTQVLAKASKIIPVMLMGKLISNKSYKYHEYGTALMISIGMTLFLLFQDNSSKRATVTTVSGVIILVLYMICDSFTSNWQGQLFKEYRMSSVQMMCGVNLFSCIFTFLSLMQQGGFSKSFLFFFEFPNFFCDCILLSICSAVGQLFIFFTISKFGPVVFVIIMTVRQALAILLSCLIYHHSVNINGIFGVTLVFTAVFLRIYFNYKKSVLSRTLPSTLSGEQKV